MHLAGSQTVKMVRFNVVVADSGPLRPARSQMAVIVVLGEIDMATVPRLLATVDDEIARGKTDLLVDLARVEFIDVTGVRALIETRERARDSGGWLRLRDPSPAVRRVFSLLDLDGLFPIASSTDDHTVLDCHAQTQATAS